MAKDKQEKKETPVEQKTVSASESEKLQAQGWVVVEMKTVDGQHVHLLEKAQ